MKRRLGAQGLPRSKAADCTLRVSAAPVGGGFEGRRRRQRGSLPPSALSISVEEGPGQRWGASLFTCDFICVTLIGRPSRQNRVLCLAHLRLPVCLCRARLGLSAGVSTDYLPSRAQQRTLDSVLSIACSVRRAGRRCSAARSFLRLSRAPCCPQSGNSRNRPPAAWRRTAGPYRSSSRRG